MTIADDTSDLLGVWGAPGLGVPGLLSIVRLTNAYSDSGAGTKTWTQVATSEGSIQPFIGIRGGGTVQTEAGVQAIADFEVFLPYGTVIQEHDRIRPPAWVAGQDEYEVLRVQPFPPSNTEVLLKLVKGHAP